MIRCELRWRCRTHPLRRGVAATLRAPGHRCSCRNGCLLAQRILAARSPYTRPVGTTFVCRNSPALRAGRSLRHRFSPAFPAGNAPENALHRPVSGNNPRRSRPPGLLPAGNVPVRRRSPDFPAKNPPATGFHALLPRDAPSAVGGEDCFPQKTRQQQDTLGCLRGKHLSFRSRSVLRHLSHNGTRRRKTASAGASPYRVAVVGRGSR